MARRIDWVLLLLVALFVAGLAPYAARYVSYYPDERHYTNAALTMLKGGDSLVPQYADGTLRLRKPILPYWAVLAGFKAFGATPLGARLPFLLAGGVVLVLTYRLARRLFDDRETARLAAAVMLANLPLIAASTRSQPDVLLCLFMLVSASGFISLLASGERRLADYAAAYVGAALGIATKGLLPVALVAFAWAFALILPRGRERLRSLAHPPLMLLAAVLAVAWYAHVARRYGPAPMAGEFVADQFGEKIARVPWHPVGNAVRILALYVAHLLPWSLPLGLALARRPGSAPHPDEGARTGQAFMLLWAEVLLLILCVSHRLSGRYLLAVEPMLAVLAADLFRRVCGQRAARFVRLLLGAVLAAMALLGLAAGVAGAWLVPAGAAWSGAAVCLVAAGALVGAAFVWRRLSPAVALAAGLFLFFPLAYVSALRHVALPNPASVAALRIEALGLSTNRPIFVMGTAGFTGQLRLHLGGRYPLRRVPEKGWPRLPRLPHQALVLGRSEGERLDLRAYDVYAVTGGVRSLTHGTWPEWRAAVAAGRLGGMLDRSREVWWIAVRRPGAPQPPPPAEAALDPAPDG